MRHLALKASLHSAPRENRQGSVEYGPHGVIAGGGVRRGDLGDVPSAAAFEVMSTSSFDTRLMVPGEEGMTP